MRKVKKIKRKAKKIGIRVPATKLSGKTNLTFLQKFVKWVKNLF